MTQLWTLYVIKLPKTYLCYSQLLLLMTSQWPSTLIFSISPNQITPLRHISPNKPDVTCFYGSLVSCTNYLLMLKVSCCRWFLSHCFTIYLDVTTYVHHELTYLVKYILFLYAVYLVAGNSSLLLEPNM